MQRHDFTKEDIREAIELRQFEVHYQPIIDKQNEKIIYGEALVRWMHPKYGLLHPGSFIHIAEKNGMISILGEYVLKEACSQSRKWKDDGHTFYRVTVNLSATQLANPEFPARVIKIIRDAGIEPDDVKLEITETMAVIEHDITKRGVCDLKDAGIRILLDDFGTGHSNMSHLRDLPVDGLKIDGQFVRHSMSSERDSMLMKSMIELAKSLNMKVVAEGVETEEQLALVQSMDCHIVQGFYFTHALPKDEYAEWCNFYTTNPSLRM